LSIPVSTKVDHYMWLSKQNSNGLILSKPKDFFVVIVIIQEFGLHFLKRS
jgi:hypothetical protein